MITADEIIHLQRQTSDYYETEILKSKLADLRAKRRPVHLTLEEFEEILRWKLGSQYGRQKKRRSANTDEVIRRVTGLALEIKHPDMEYEIELRIGILCALRGVGIPVASAVLALVFPESYAVIDFRVWRQLFGDSERGFSVSDYKRYLKALDDLANQLTWPIQEIDHAIWEYDRRYYGTAESPA